MKKLILTVFIALTSVVAVSAQEMSEAMKLYLSGCVAFRDAVEHNDFPALTDAKLALSELELEKFLECDYTIADDDSRAALSSPKIIFTPEFAAEMIRKGIISIEEDAEDVYTMRGNPELHVLHASIAPRSRASFSSMGMDDCEMLLFAMSDSSMQLSVESAGVPAQVSPLAEGAAWFATWNMPSELAEYTFTVINNGDKPATFVIALN